MRIPSNRHLLILLLAATCWTSTLASCRRETPLTFADPPAGSYTAGSFTLTIGNASTTLAGAAVTQDFFSATRVAPMLGRAFVGGDAAAGAAPVVILSRMAWQSRFGGDPSIIGRALDIDGRPTTVVGIMPQGFEFPAGAQLWVLKR